MKLEITSRSNLALLSIRRLAGAADWTSRPALAAVVGTSPEFLAQVMTPLVRAGWVESVPGRNGGYRLAVEPASVSVLDLITVVEGLPSADRCVLRGGPCQPEERCALHDAWMPARESLLEALRRTPVMNPITQEHQP